MIAKDITTPGSPNESQEIPQLRYSRDVETHLRITPEKEAHAELSGLVTSARSSGRIRFFDLRDTTGTCQLIAERQLLTEADWVSVVALRKGNFASISGRVGFSSRGQTSVFLSRGPSQKDGSLASPISGSSPDYAAVGTQIFLARLRHRAAEFFRNTGYVELEPKFISADWRFLGLEPLRIVYPGFGAAAFLAPTPSTQLMDALAATGTGAVFSCSRCFSSTYRDEQSSAESLIVSAKWLGESPINHYELICDAVRYVFSGLETFPEAGLFPENEWAQTSVSEILENHQGKEVAVPTLEVYSNPSIARGPDGARVSELVRLVWPLRRTIAEGSQEVLDSGQVISSTTIHIERMVSLLRNLPVRHIRNLGG
jgi:OB-fold nucleic acid binding domain